MTKTYRGSCHCGRVRYEADIDLAKDGTTKCNCTICTKARWWGTTIPQRAFRLLAGEDALSTYNFRPGATLLHHFCRLCGVRVMITGYVEELGGDIVTLQVATLDDVEPAELLEAPISYLDGKNDAWWNPPAEFRHL